MSKPLPLNITNPLLPEQNYAANASDLFIKSRDQAYQWHLHPDDNHAKQALWLPAYFYHTMHGDAAANSVQYFLSFKTAYKNAQAPLMLLDTIIATPQKIFYRAYEYGVSTIENPDFCRTSAGQEQGRIMHNGIEQIKRAITTIVAWAGDRHPMHEALSDDNTHIKDQPDLRGAFRGQQARNKLEVLVDHAMHLGARTAQGIILSNKHPSP